MSENQNININIDIDAIVHKLIHDKSAMRLIAEALRTTQTSQARRMGNLYGDNAQRPTPKPASKSRLS